MGSMVNQVAIVTGAVGNLGRAVAHRFLERDAQVILLDRSLERLIETFPSLADNDRHMLIGNVDLSAGEEVAAVFRRIVDHFGRVDVLVNTVGGFQGGKSVEEESPDTWDRLFHLNVLTAVNTCRSAAPLMRARGTGRIINVASPAALKGDAGLAAYSASKAALLRMTESLADELKDANVNAVLPGTLDTPQNREAMPTADHSRWVPPEAVADVILFLASDESRAINGAAIPVYGRG